MKVTETYRLWLSRIARGEGLGDCPDGTGSMHSELDFFMGTGSINVRQNVRRRLLPSFNVEQTSVLLVITLRVQNWLSQYPAYCTLHHDVLVS